MADFKDHVVIFSILFLCFRFLSRRSRPRQSLFLLMRTTQISKAVLSTMMLISRRRQRVLHRRRMNRPKVWVYPRDQRWFGEINRNPAMHGWVPVFSEEDAFISSLALLTSSAICCHFCELPLPFNPLLRSLQRLIKISSSAVLQVILFFLGRAGSRWAIARFRTACRRMRYRCK